MEAFKWKGVGSSDVAMGQGEQGTENKCQLPNAEF